MNDGKIGIAPCGHSGVHYTVNYIRCVQGCKDDAIPVGRTPVADASYPCPGCSSNETEEYVAPYFATLQTHMHCIGCGKVWQI